MFAVASLSRRVRNLRACRGLAAAHEASDGGHQLGGSFVALPGLGRPMTQVRA